MIKRGLGFGFHVNHSNKLVRVETHDLDLDFTRRAQGSVNMKAIYKNC